MRAFKRILGLLLLVVFLAAPIVVISNVQALEDWWRLKDYTPPPAVAKLAEDDSMTDEARHLFYVSHPELISNKAQFHAACPLSEETIVLGCYYHKENSIYEGIALYDVTDSRLSGVEEVTAAHEMLHGAYDRLGSDDKKQINSLLVDYYNNNLKDERVKATIDSYRKTEPNDLVNEMHSIFGTEVSDLPAPLEEYYKKYFNNRRAVLNFSDQYKSVFAENKAQLDSIKAKIEQLKSQLSQDKVTIESEQNALFVESRRMQNLISSGKTAQYNAAVEPYNSRVLRLRSLTSAYNSKVNQVNQLVEQYNALAYTQEGLYQSLDSRLETHTAQ